MIIILIMVPPDTELYSSGGMAVAGWLEGPTGRVEQVSIMDMTIMMITMLIMINLIKKFIPPLSSPPTRACSQRTRWCREPAMR